MNYLKDQDLYGILFKDIVNQYIVVENNNLKEFASKMGVQNTDKIPNKIESTKVSEYLSYEEIKPLMNKYLNIAIESIPEDNYSKVEKGDVSLGDKTVQADGYQIKLKAKDVQSISTKVLESAKNDEQLFNLVSKLSNEEITFEDYQNNINDVLTELSGEISKEENVDFAYITIYKQGKDAVKLSVNIVVDEDKKFEIALDKTDKGLSLKYYGSEKVYSIFDGEISFNENEEENTNNNTDNNLKENIIIITKTSNTEEQESFDFNIIQKSNGEETGNYTITFSRTGALTSDNVIFSILMPFNSDDGNINIQFKNTANFSATPQFEEFTEGNHLVINGVSPEQLNNLFKNLGDKISEKLKDEMLLSVITNANSLSYDLRQNSMDVVEETNTALNNEMSMGFNVQFEFYQGNKKGTEVKGLLSAIDMNNSSNPEHTITYGNISTEEIDSNKEYNISFEKDENGYINKAIIN